MREKERKKFRKIRRIVGISALVLAFAITIVPTSSFAEQTRKVSVPDSKIAVEIKDNRADAPDDRDTTASVLGISEGTTLTLRDAQGTEIFTKMKERVDAGAYDEVAFYDSDFMSAFAFDLTVNEEKDAVTYQSMTMMLSIPKSYRQDGYLEVLGITENGYLGRVYLDKSSADTSYITFLLTQTSYPKNEFVLLFHAKPLTTVNDGRTDASRADKTTAAIEKDLYTDRVFSVKSGAATIKGLIDANGSYPYDDLSVFTTALTDRSGNAISNYGKLSVQLALPDAFDPKNGTVKLFSVDESGKLVTEVNESYTTAEGFATFQTETTGEYAFAYFEKASEEKAVHVTDNRKDCASAGKTTALVEKNYTEGLYLTIESSAGEIIKPLIEANGTYPNAEISAFTMTMTDAATDGKIVSDFGVCTVTMALPDGMDVSKGRVYLLGVNKDGTLNADTDAKQTTIGSGTYLTFETSEMNEFAFVYMTSARTKAVLKVKDSAGNASTLASEISATLTSENADSYYLSAEKITSFEDLSGADAYLYEQIKDSKSFVLYSLSVKDSAGNETSDFTSCELSITLDSAVDSKKQKAGAVTVKTNADGSFTKEELTAAVSGKVVTFTTKHFTPFAVTVNDIAAGTTNAATGSSTANNTNSNTANNGTTQSTAQAAPNAVVSPVVVNNNQPAAGTGSSSTRTSGTADMPRTADATTYRNVLVMILAVFGALMLVSSFRFERTVRRKKGE